MSAPSHSAFHEAHIHRQTSAIQICPGRAISVNSRFYRFLPIFFLLFFSTFLWVFKLPSGLKVSILTKHNDVFFLYSEDMPQTFPSTLPKFIIDVVDSCPLCDLCMLSHVSIVFLGFFLTNPLLQHPPPQKKTPLGATFISCICFQCGRPGVRLGLPDFSPGQ